MTYPQSRKKRPKPENKPRPSFKKEKPESSLNRHLPFSILFQDRDIIVVDKPAGLLTVPFAGGHSRNLLELLNKHFAREKTRPQVVHRIDRYTSGLVLFAKNPKARDFLVEQFRAHTPERTYLAVIHGAISPAEGKLVHYLKKNENNFKQHVTTKKDERGTPARLSYRTLEKWQKGSLLEVKLDTGLKNQIRVQLAEEGYPIIGDQQYGKTSPLDERIGRQSLHAASLSFIHPADNTRRSFESPLAKDIVSLLRFLARPNTK